MCLLAQAHRRIDGCGLAAALTLGASALHLPVSNKQRQRSTPTLELPSAALEERACGSPSEPGGRDATFPLVGIGTSAGALPALRELFAQVPEGSGAAYVVVVHLSPQHESHMEELLQPYVKMPVRQVRSTVVLERDHVYIIPPNANLDTIDTHLRLTPLETRRSERAPIGHFFHTLADVHDGNSIGVVLTGSGTDGSVGLRRIKETGGLTIVQDPAEAEYSGMPKSAIAVAQPDFILRLAQIPDALLRFIRTAPRLLEPDTDENTAEFRRFLQKAFAQVRSRTGRDFTHYKRSTVLRRIARRMQFNQLQDPSRYLELLRSSVEEIHALADDLLITVTNFFRDVEVFEALETKVIPAIFAGKSRDDVVRVWSVGCATGEEAYSLAMLLHEEAARREEPHPIQVFASDLHQASLDTAREGLYPSSIEIDVRPDRLKRFFQKEGDGFRVRKELRELVIFAPHNILADPPFSRVDLVSCRNLLIYLQRDLQEQVTELFHYALRQDGFLVLGTSESVETGELFRVEDKRRCLYRKRNVPPPEPRLPVFPLAHTRLGSNPRRVDPLPEPLGYADLHQQLTDALGPPSVLLSADDNVAHFSGRAGRYFVQPGGAPTTNVFKLVREELRVELRSALVAARLAKSATRSLRVAVHFDGPAPVTLVTLDVRPAQERDREGLVLLTFEEHLDEGASSAGPQRARQEPPGAHEIAAEKQLQAIIEQYGTSQEDLKASNEELQSANEELRSTLEELETSKEELQSMNEELETVNQDYRFKVEELGQLSSDLQNLLAATDIATMFLDREMRILRFTPKVAELFNVRQNDRGRPLSDLTHRLKYDSLQADATEVLTELVPIEREVRDDTGRWYLTRILPYRSGADRIAGTVVTFVEITLRKLGEDALRSAKEYSEKVIEALPGPLCILTADHRIQSGNAAFYEHFELRAELALGQSIYSLSSAQWAVPALRALLDEAQTKHGTVSGYALDGADAGAGQRHLALNARRLEERDVILLGMQDLTNLSKAEHALRQSTERLSRMVNVDGVGILIFDESGTVVDANDTFLAMFGYSRHDVTERTLSRWKLTPPEYVEISLEQHDRLQQTGRIGPYEKEYFRKDRSRAWMVFAGATLGDGTVIEYCIDVSDRRRAEQALRSSEARLAMELAAMVRLHELVARLLVCSDLPTALGDVLAAAIELTGAGWGHVQLFDAAHDALEVVAHQGFSATYLDSLEPLDENNSTALSTAVRSRERVVIEDIETDPGSKQQRQRAAAAGYRGVQITPLLSRSGELLGVLSTHYAKPYHPSERDLRFLDLYARQAADFIDRRRSDEQLQQTQVRLGEENRHKDEYLAMLGHELRNPLAAIRNATELLKRSEASDPSIIRAQGVLERQSSHVARLIDGLLEVSRIARGKVDLELDPLDLNELLERVLQDRTPQASVRNVTLERQLTTDRLRLMGDDVRLVQVFDNLIGNALKFTPAGGSIHVTSERDGATAVVRVKDTGIGIRRQMLTRIFDAFQQEQQDVARSAGGLGLGLALAKGLVTLHQGSIEARSPGPGLGSEFEVRLLLTTIVESERAPPRVAEVGRRRIFIIEDNADAAEMLCALLELREHEVTVADNGVTALELLRQKGADVVLCDLGLPGMSGYDIARAIRADDGLARIPLVALTGYGQPSDRQRSAAAGFNAHLVKPVALYALDAVLGEIFEPVSSVGALSAE